MTNPRPTPHTHPYGCPGPAVNYGGQKNAGDVVVPGRIAVALPVTLSKTSSVGLTLQKYD